MIKHISYMPNNNSISEFKKNKEILSRLGISEIETIIADYCPEEVFNSLPIGGVHLLYFPTWLDIWNENKANILEDFHTTEPYGIKSKQEYINVFREQFELAKKHNAKYMVFHISHIRPRDIFTLSYDYSHFDILEATLELVNEVFKGDGPPLLFENLPWPGFDLKNEELILNFLDKINYKSKGIMMDFSHFICLNKELNNYDEGAIFIKNELNKMPEVKSHIRGIHLNGSISKEYLSNDFSPLLAKWENSSRLDRYHVEIGHIKKIDTHDIFRSKLISEVINDLNPEFLVYELAYTSLEDLISKVEIQNSFLDFIK